MDAIFKSGNVYVPSPSGDVRSGINIWEIPELVCVYRYKKSADLYGGRVQIKTWEDDLTMLIDGIRIVEIRLDSTGRCEREDLSVQQASAFLNQIENLGVDTFLDNYKVQLQTLKSEIENSALKLEQELSVQFDDEKDSLLKNLRTSIRSLSAMIFMLFINLNAGLDNHCYIEAYETISNLYF